MGAAKKIELTPDETFLQDALRTGRAIKTEISMKALGKPDVELQARVNHLDMTHVHRLGTSLENQGFLAPVVVFKDAKSKLWLADGHHRHECYRKAGKSAIPAYQVKGERLDALEFATMCNRENCLGRTKEDEKKALFMLLGQEAWFHKSTPVIGRHVGVSSSAVFRWRAQYCDNKGIELPLEVVGSDGRVVKATDKRNTKILGKPEPRHNGAQSYHFKTVGGKRHYLGNSVIASQTKLDDLTRDYEADKKKLRGCDFAKWLAYRGLHAQGLNRGPMGLGSVFLTKNAILVPAELCTLNSITELIGRALLNRHKHLSDGRAIVVCYDPPQCEALDVAKDMGIEFMTPEELVESLKEPNA